MRNFPWSRRREAVPPSALEAALAESRARYKALVELTSDFAWETGPDGAFVFVSPRGALGYEAAELVGRQPDTFAAAPRSPAEPSPFAARDPVADVTVWWRRKDGGEACLSVSATPIADASGAWRGTRGVCRDTTDALARDDALAAAQRREGLLAHILHVMRDVAAPSEMLAAAAAASARALGACACRIEAAGPDGRLVPAAAFGPPPSPDEAKPLMRATYYRQAMNGRVSFVRAAGEAPWSDEDRALLADIADRIGLALTQAGAHEALARAARTDALTGLLNRRAFLDELATRNARRGTGASAAPSALYFVDLDNFKAVNDGGGHDHGDAALRAVAALLVAHTRPGDLAARLGGDEFALWLERIEPAAAAARADDLVAAAVGLARFSPAGSRNVLGFSMGAVTWQGGAEIDPAALIARADAAMYRVKRSGKGGFAIVDGADDPSGDDAAAAGPGSAAA